MNRRSSVAIGLTVVVSLCFVVRALIFLHPTPGDGQTKLCVRFQNVDKIAAGSRVTFAGKPVGEVVTVRLLQESFQDRSASRRPIYPYEVMLAIDSSVKVYTVDEISVKTAGLMGEHFIAIVPKTPKEGEDLVQVKPSDVLFASGVGGADETIQEIASVARKADQTMEALISVIDRNQEGIYQTTEAIRNASRELESFLSTLNSGKFGEKLVAVSDKSISCLDKIEALSIRLERASRGEGSVGRMLVDPSLYENMLLAAKRTNQLVTDIDTYGLLFHTNRDWQREIARRSSETFEVEIAAQKSLQERFEKIQATVSELQSTLESAKRRLQDESLSEEFSTMQRQIADLQSTMSGSSQELTGDVED